MESAPLDQVAQQTDAFGALENPSLRDAVDDYVWDWRITANHNEIVVAPEV